MFHRHHQPTTTTTRTSKPSFMTRLRGPNSRSRTVKTTTTTRQAPTTHRTTKRHWGTTQPHHHRRTVTLGDKMSGAMSKLRGTLTRRPGLKAAGTCRMHGTDGRGGHHHVY